MAEIDLTQAEADALTAMDKHRVNEDRATFPWVVNHSSFPFNLRTDESTSYST